MIQQISNTPIPELPIIQQDVHVVKMPYKLATEEIYFSTKDSSLVFKLFLGFETIYYSPG